ncbi:glycosyltransferase family A protein [Xanthocytophaga agilis]|uniref:Glycosyltransferase family A protein n=1 Tax=Xanthocytophaga agilis TaxID=3048010 RepID=A0AAE3UH19_9BACT|nr:glycosyltransferase family A protein [Xanthocytophaga agilis]MDJ1502188.1 glycosyltransferase family A protein [Xanthocytophaga agilis]
MPVVSVIIPNYNHALYLPQRIESVQNQTFQDIEIIILDDCSTDNSRDVISNYARTDKRIQTLFNTQNSGSPFKQWAKGLNLAKGEYIWIAESDDYADPVFLEKLTDILKVQPQVGIVYSQSWQVDAQGKIITSCRNLYKTLEPKSIHSGKSSIANHFSGANIIPNASAVVFRKNLVDKINSDYQTFRLSGDWLFWCQMLSLSDLVYVDEELNYFRLHAQKVTVASHKDQTFIIENLRILDLLHHQKLISDMIYQSKSKNVARQLKERQQKSETSLPFAQLRSILRYALRNNTTFLLQYLKLSFR